MREVPQRLASPSEETPKEKKKKKVNKGQRDMVVLKKETHLFGLIFKSCLK